MYNVKMTLVTNGHQFSSDMYPDTGCAESIIAANLTERQRLSILPHKRQLQSAEEHQWPDHIRCRIPGTNGKGGGSDIAIIGGPFELRCPFC